MNFAEAVKNETKWTRTENGAVALNTTGNACLDLFGSIGSLRGADPLRVQRLFEEAWKENPVIATKIVFYARDIRGGLGERETFRNLIHYMAIRHPEAVCPNIDLIGGYGRYDDLYALCDTPLEDKMWEYARIQFQHDMICMQDNLTVSLLAKWLKTADASSKRTRKLGIYTALKLGMKVRDYKRTVRELRKYIDVTERKMSANEWDKINYEAVPSRAMMNYRAAFTRHDLERYKAFIDKANKGEATIHSGTLYPYDIIEKIGGFYSYDVDDTLEAQWKQLPNYVEPGTNAIVMADTSGSMRGRPLASAIGLAIYFAERNTGAYHNLWMSFSGNPKFHMLKGDTLAQKLSSIDMGDWQMNTNLHAAFRKILDLAVNNNIPQNEMVKSIIVISDMEIDDCGDSDWSFYDHMRAEYARHGYKIPNVVFWNVDSRHDIFHADSKRKGVQLVSGQSASTFKNLVGSIGMTPVEMMMKVIGDARYAPIKVEGIN